MEEKEEFKVDQKVLDEVRKYSSLQEFYLKFENSWKIN